LNEKIKNSNLLNNGGGSNETDNLSLNELREVVLAMIQRKEEIEQKNKIIIESYNEEKLKSKGLSDKVASLEKESKMLKDNYHGKLQNLEYENNLLKEQLKKYVSAMSMIRSRDDSLVNTEVCKERIPIMPTQKENLHRDYSFEAEQYEKKLIQVNNKFAINFFN
jgi:sorting nexin-29